MGAKKDVCNTFLFRASFTDFYWFHTASERLPFPIANFHHTSWLGSIQDTASTFSSLEIFPIEDQVKQFFAWRKLGKSKEMRLGLADLKKLFRISASSCNATWLNNILRLVWLYHVPLCHFIVV